MAKMKKIKKAQFGNKAGYKRSPVSSTTQESALNEWRPDYRSMVMGPKSGVDSLARKKAIAAGLFKEDKKSGDIYPTAKYYKPGRITPGEQQDIAKQKKGGKTVAKKKAVKKAVKPIKKKK